MENNKSPITKIYYPGGLYAIGSRFDEGVIYKIIEISKNGEYAPIIWYQCLDENDKVIIECNAATCETVHYSDYKNRKDLKIPF